MNKKLDKYFFVGAVAPLAIISFIILLPFLLVGCIIVETTDAIKKFSKVLLCLRKKLKS